MKRRNFVKSLLGMAGGLSVMNILGSVSADETSGVKGLSGPGKRKRVLRVAHMTDVHLTSAGGAEQGFTKALRQVQAMDDPPQMIINGGDAIMCSFSSLEADAQKQWDLWQKVIGNECGLPMFHCIGNHDIWGWDRHLSQTTGDEPLWGKGWVMEALKMPDRYYSANRAGWHFVSLDSTQHFGDPLGAALTAHIDDEQWDWLEKDLAAHAAMPTLIVSHMPITTVTSFYDGNGNRYDRSSDLWTIPGGWMHTDGAKLRDLFRKHRQVKLCLSGHMHQVDEILFDNVGYCCSGAVCGDWWKGPYFGFDEGYALVDLYDDGTYTFRYETYGWKARPG